MVEITTTGKANGRVLVSYGRLDSIQAYGFDTHVWSVIFSLLKKWVSLTLSNPLILGYLDYSDFKSGKCEVGLSHFDTLFRGTLNFWAIPFWLVSDHTTKGKPQTEAALLILFQTEKFKGVSLWGCPLQGVRQTDLPFYSTPQKSTC